MNAVLRNLICIFTVFLFLLFFIPIFVNIINIGNITGMVITTLIFLISLKWNQLILIYNRLIENKLGRLFIVLMSIMIGVILLTALILTIGMVLFANKAPASASTVIVLGCKVNGNSPSLMLKGRLDCAYNYLTENADSVCIVSGGMGEDEEFAEAIVMKNYLVNRGINVGRIYLEDKSANTKENIEFSADIIKQNKLSENTAIVTDGFHQMRAAFIVKENKLKFGALSAETPLYLLPTYYIREMYGLLEQIFLK